MDYIIIFTKVLKYEVVEIGAVKLDWDGTQKGEFHKFICPLINNTFKESEKGLPYLTQEILDTSSSFNDVFKEFLAWVGDDSLIVSWGNFDKDNLRKSCEFNNYIADWEILYTDFRKIYADIKKVYRCSLKKALRSEGIPADDEIVNALDVARKITKLFLKDIDIWGI